MRSLLTWTTALLLGLTAPSLVLAGDKGTGGKGAGTSHYSPGYHRGSGPKYVSPYHPSVDKYHDSKSDKYRDYRSDRYHDTRSDYYGDHHLRYNRDFGTGGYYRYFDRNFGGHLYPWPGTYGWYYFSVPSCCYYPVWTVPYLAYFWGAQVGY